MPVCQISANSLRLQFAKPAIQLLFPTVTAHRLKRVEAIVRVVPGFDLVQAIVMGAIKHCLPVGLPEIRFVKIRASIGSEPLKLRQQVIRHLLLVTDIGRLIGEAVRSAEDGAKERLTPVGISANGIRRRYALRYVK
ncbi:hypothetical protein GJ744_000316 [Endocarpon pusillum]|uniref:Uncharacterized protein n=1 Tax=Endocarpon pusillum TaxID=364733 RepID=A0A8H7ASJ5_9EURO|nr:hypothetical protein GJ744_000316 [Endocarpon pusillum]